jgi:prepilin-type processing-associated H-X9-DG protein
METIKETVGLGDAGKSSGTTNHVLFADGHCDAKLQQALLERQWQMQDYRLHTGIAVHTFSYH